MPDSPHRPPIDENDARFIIVEATPAMLWLGDEQGNCVYLNREQREFWGVRPDLGDFSWDRTLHPDDAARLWSVQAAAMQRQIPFEAEARYRRADGVWRILHTSARPRFSADGTFLGMVGQNREVTEQRAAEERLKRTAEQLNLALDAAQGVGTWQWNASDGLLQGDRRFGETFGIDPDQVAKGIPFKRVLRSILRADRDAFARQMKSAMAQGGVYRSEFRVDSGGTPRWLLATGSCELGPDGRPAQFAGVVLDISEHKAREARLDLLARELAHRIKNIFAVLGGMARLSARDAPESGAAFESFQGRLAAMAAAYAQIIPTDEQMNQAGTMLSLLDRLFAPFNAERGAHVVVSGPDLPLSTKAASNLALIFHELATNAAKYGALANSGTVRLTIEQVGGAEVSFAWEEEMPDRTVVAPAALGFGSRVLELASSNLGAQAAATWRPEGLLWTMVAPLASLSDP
jgi:PAS domain S-box-containing protein